MTEAGESWPALLAEEALDCLTRLLDEDDVLLDIYRRAIMRDCVDAAVSSYMAAHKALRILMNPDVTMAAMWEANRDCTAMQQGSKLLLRCGLVPFGAWAAVAATSAHEPCIMPEARSLRQMLDGPSPTPWSGPNSLVVLAAGLAATMNEIRAMKVHYDTGLLLSPLVNKLQEAPKCAGFEAWDGFLFRSISTLGRWGNSALSAEEALSSMVIDLNHDSGPRDGQLSRRLPAS